MVVDEEVALAEARYGPYGSLGGFSLIEDIHPVAQVEIAGIVPTSHGPEDACPSALRSPARWSVG